MASGQPSEKLKIWQSGSKFKLTLAAFTLIEAVIALLVVGMALSLILLVWPQLKQSWQTNPQPTLQTALNQLQKQNYQLKNTQPSEVDLVNEKGKPARLLVKNHKLRVASEGRGQVILMQGVLNMTVEAHPGYDLIQLNMVNKQVAKGILFLPQKFKEEAHDDKKPT
ncbi:type II secretion system protein [Lactobacillaceae bacterium L1_55_11]|nr:type II secretion system protein [Lactobacillaceae bacterium L1_55_11]